MYVCRLDLWIIHVCALCKCCLAWLTFASLGGAITSVYGRMICHNDDVDRWCFHGDGQTWACSRSSRTPLSPLIHRLSVTRPLRLSTVEDVYSWRPWLTASPGQLLFSFIFSSSLNGMSYYNDELSVHPSVSSPYPILWCCSSPSSSMIR